MRSAAKGPSHSNRNAAEISALIQEHCFLYLEAPVQRITGFDTFMPYYKLELDYLPDAKRITQGRELSRQRIREVPWNWLTMARMAW